MPEDYQLLLKQIKILLQNNNILLTSDLLKQLNKAITCHDYSRIDDIIGAEIGITLAVNQQLLPRLMEMCNIRKIIDFLNGLPGIDGNSVNCIKVQDLL